ncbi:mannosyltransferase [Kalmusia sp. IMI 367209]|nr:mannosyltransferase [Kalmusia sp. IMI 367209]
MYILTSYSTIVFVLAILTWAHPNPPIVNSDGTSAITESKLDTSLASLEGLTHNQRDNSGRKNGPADKYFHESTFDSHYDGRFASVPLPPEERLRNLRALLRTYLSTMHALGAETWLMHGSLLGWWWNRRIMPWDSDIDVQVSESAIDFLASYYNMSVHSFQDVDWLGDVDMHGREERIVSRDGGPGDKRKYLLEINPHWRNGSDEDRHNVIDGRWIDTRTGLYIDITSVRRDASHPVPGYLYCKDKHHYLMRQIFPLRTSVFEGVPAKIPYAYQELLAEEYGAKSLVETVYEQEGHVFDAERMEWVRMTGEQQKALDGQGSGKFGQNDVERQNQEEMARAKAQAKAHALAMNPNAENKGGIPKPGQIGEVHQPPGNSNDF